MPAEKRTPSPPPAPPKTQHDREGAPPAGGRDGVGDADGGGAPVPASSAVQQPRNQRPPEEEEGGEEEKPQSLPQPQPKQEQQQGRDGGVEDGEEIPHLQEKQKDGEEIPQLQEKQKDVSEGDDDDDGGSPSSSGTAANEKSEFILVKLADIHREVQCPICLGIIRKTRTVMECLHRFCRECIDKSMRLGNNECPACRTHCASRRSLRDDPNYDALIAVLYPDIDKYEEEELALHDEDKLRNKKIQASIAQTYLRQSEALGKRRPSTKATTTAFLERSQGNFQSSHGNNSYPRSRSRVPGNTAPLASDDDEEEAIANYGGKHSSMDESSPEIVRQKKRRRWVPCFSTAPRPSVIDGGYDEQDDLEIRRETYNASPGRVGNREVLAWGKNGARSQTRHGSSGGSVSKNMKGSRITKLIEYLHNLNENENEFDIHLTLLPLDEQNLPSLQQPYLCCRPTLLVRHLCQFIARQLPVQAEEVEILAIKYEGGNPALGAVKVACDETIPGHKENYKELQILEAQESLAALQDYLFWSKGDLVLVYRSKSKHHGT